MTRPRRLVARAPQDQLQLLVENYRRARNRATTIRAELSRIDLDGRYHLDGVTPPSVERHGSMHDEKMAALALADSLVRWIDGHE